MERTTTKIRFTGPEEYEKQQIPVEKALEENGFPQGSYFKTRTVLPVYVLERALSKDLIERLSKLEGVELEAGR